MKIWLASYPRSGNTYTRTLLNRFYGLKHTSVYEEKENGMKKKIKPFFYTKEPEDQPVMNEDPDHPVFVKTHEMPCDGIPAIYLVRDGRDALVSYAWYIVTFLQPSNSDFQTVLKNLIIDPGYFGGWGAHVLAWINRSAPTAVIKFEELVTTQTPQNTLEKAFQKINFKNFNKVEKPHMPSFKRLQELWPEFFRKGKIGGWKKEMPPELNDLFWENHGMTMKEMGYSYN